MLTVDPEAANTKSDEGAGNPSLYKQAIVVMYIPFLKNNIKIDYLLLIQVIWTLRRGGDGGG